MTSCSLSQLVLASGRGFSTSALEHLGPDHCFFFGGLSCAPRMFSNTPVSKHLGGASSTPTAIRTTKNVPQALPRVPWGAKVPLAEDHRWGVRGGKGVGEVVVCSLRGPRRGPLGTLAAREKLPKPQTARHGSATMGPFSARGKQASSPPDI